MYVYVYTCVWCTINYNGCPYTFSSHYLTGQNNVSLVPMSVQAVELKIMILRMHQSFVITSCYSSLVGQTFFQCYSKLLLKHFITEVPEY